MAKSSGKAGSLFYGMTLDTTDFKKQLKDARKNLKKAGQEIKVTIGAISSGFAIAAAGVGLGTVAMLAFAKSTAESTNAQILLADSIGATQADIAGLELASTRWGVEQTMLIDKMREAGGIDAFKKIADQVKGAGDESAQMAKSMELLGNEGLKLLPILQQGSEGLNSMTKEAFALGTALNPEQIAQNNVVWTQFENTLLKVDGIGKQIGTSFLEMFGTVSSGADAFITTFGDDIKGAFADTADFMTSAIKRGFEVFIDFGIPFINGFINFANNIGDAFSNVFSFIRGDGDSTFSFLAGFFDGFNAFLATFQQTFTAGITGSISTVINGAFGLVAGFNDFLGGMIGGLAQLLEDIGLEDEGFAKNVRDAFADQSKEIKGFGKDLAEPFKVAAEDNINAAAKILEEQRKKNEADQAKFTAVLGNFNLKFAEASKVAADSSSKIISDAIKSTAGLSSERGGLALTGSQTEFNIRNSQGNKQIELATKQLTEQTKTRRALEKLEVV